MKKLLVILLSFVCLSAYSQTTEVRINPNDEAGYVERYALVDDTVIFIDSNYTIEFTQMNIEVEGEDSIDHCGWLDFDMGIPDLSEYPLEGYDSIIIVANFVTDGVGIKEGLQYNYRVFPNPTTNLINVQGEFDNIVIYNQVGQQVISTNKSRIDVSKLSSGMYYIQIHNGDKMKTMPIVKTNKGRI